MYVISIHLFNVRPTVFRGKFCQIPRRHLPNSAGHHGKFLEFHGSPQHPILEYTVPTLAQLCPKTLALLSHQTIEQKFYTNFQSVVILQGRRVAYTELLCHYTTTVLTHT